MTVEPTKFQVIQCKDYIYISEGKKEKSSYYSSSSVLPNLLFDGEKAEKTYKDRWYKLSKIPTCVQKKSQDKHINIRYELKDGYTPSDLMPKVINLESLYETEYSEISGLYKRVYDIDEGIWEDILFEIEVIYIKDDFEWIQKKYQSSPDLISQIEFHPDLLQEVPCRISSEDMYGIIRSYVKANINPLVATVTSDYDFHFEVKRKIIIAEPYSYNVDTNASNKRKKPNWVKKWVNSKEETVLNIKSKASDSNYGTDCRLAPVIYGHNQLDLEEKVNAYLTQLMEDINIQYKECPHCKGWGIIKESKNGEESL